jgi:hypothetical protein
MKLFRKFYPIILGLICLIALGAAKVVKIENLDSVQWYRTGQIEKFVKFTLGPDELDGDSLIFYKGQPATITEMYCKSVMRGTAYTAATDDTIKVYGNYGSVGTPIAYIADSLFVTNVPLVSSTALTTGIMTGTEFSIGIPDSKFSTGNNLIDIYAKIVILK